MLKFLLSFITAITGRPFVTHRGMARVRDVAFPFRMGAGFPGDVNRTHPVSIEPNLIDAAAPPTIYGQAVLQAAANAGVRPIGAADAAITKIWGTLVRPYPVQQSSGGMTADFGSATPPASGVTDVMRSGYMIVQIPVAQADTPAKGGAVFVRYLNAAAGKPVGGFEAAADGGNTIALDTYLYTFNGPADAAGHVELCVNV